MITSLDFDAVAVAKAMADAAREATLPHFRSLKAIENKKDGGDFDPVTEADKAAERAMRSGELAPRRPLGTGTHLFGALLEQQGDQVTFARVRRSRLVGELSRRWRWCG